MISTRFRPFLSWVVFFCFLAVAPLAIQSLGLEGGGRYQIGVLNDIGLYAILALSLNLILGQCGLYNMGHTAFFAVGAYTTGVLNTIGLPFLGVESIPIMWTMPLAGCAAVIFAFIVIRPIIHLRGDYLLVVTIGIMEIVRIALVNDVFGLTGGASGIYGISRPEIFGFRVSTPVHFYYLIWTIAAITIVLFYSLEHSRFGRALNYIKQDDLAASGCGIDVAKYKLSVFMLGAFWAGVVGTLYAAKMRTIAPDAFNFSESVLLFAVVILGGTGSIPGVLLGACLLVGLPELLREFASARLLFFGAAMVLMMIFRPQGLLPARYRRYKARQYLDIFPSAVVEGEKLGDKQNSDARGGL